ncbi:MULTISPECIES: glutathione S-transferase family protein [Sinorhizobium]|jgi:glutathione S-transferase|uniref:Glutathione S-transferase domain-containing protein n=2 Tax=Sinorhizobium TaxID=28105 RepID=H0G3S4_RHIML|nr:MULTISPECIES: glutathione S-transferase family protein [Sinorhizobium]AEG52712.1 Glutathione S-transferase domain protein [Sinorhizobium meliloti AK83]ASP76571.1 beta-aryl ether-cleaving protein [Sinorhizobium meliloti]ASP84886.1 beta-aryl ether-cleaving protein [Sinorhizobium meliloti]EHK76027.1 glutathione S-transferase domain-containing protein [Sinorhizobium meliloti CCNWSX0020]KKA15874.1 beta-aryl ether-cleaving protein [Sinorhizobium meliloti]
MTRKLYALSGTDTSRPFSPHVWKTKLSLAHKGLAFDIAPVGFTEIPRLEQGATKIVPLLRDGEKLVSDSFDIALYLEEAYPDRPPLFSGEGGKAMARFVEGWSQTTLHPAIGRIAIMDIHDSLDPIDRAYFRASREERFGRPLEAVAEAGRGDLETFSAKLEPIRHMLKFQPFLGGDRPLFADYIVFGALQWARIVSPHRLLAAGDVVTDWFERCLDLHDGLGRSVTAA